mgnify:CR=1 FL=1
MQKNITEALVVHCIDFRFQGHLNRWLVDHIGEGNYDRVAFAGGAYDFETVFKQLDLAVDLHEIKRVILINHEDCGAYGAAGTRERHAADLTTARQRILARYPTLKIETFYHRLNGKLEPFPQT